MALHTPKIEILSQKETVIFKPRGLWVAKATNVAESLCQDILKKTLPNQLIFDLAYLQEFDTAGIWLLQRTIQSLKEKGHLVKIQNESETFLALSARLETYKPSLKEIPKPPSFFQERLVKLGKETIDLIHLTRDLITFLGEVATTLFLTLMRPKQLRLTSIVFHIEQFGVNAIPIISIMSLALGLVLAYQGEEQLRRFGAEIYTINLVSISVLREVGILITAILVAGRTGSAITAQLGTMKINQEVDALNTLGLNPMKVLIIPRVLALIIVMPF